ncbi:MAG: PD-(D/E)XK nuclease family transposase [Desulfovibrio sp.]|nr:PD-(D/E)XK nuclease family transposase [Desulfovibrio sp.]
MECLIPFENFNRTNDHFINFLFINEDHKDLLISFINSIITSINLPKIIYVEYKDREFNTKTYKRKRWICRYIMPMI